MAEPKYIHVHSRRLGPRQVDIVGFWHNVGYVVHGNRLTISLGRGLENDLRNSDGGQSRARFTIILCPKKVHAWRTSRTAPAISGTASPPVATARSVTDLCHPPPPPAPCQPAIERMLGLRMPPDTRMWLFDA